MSDQERERHDRAVAARVPFRDIVMTRHNMGRKPRIVSVSGEPIFDRTGPLPRYRGRRARHSRSSARPNADLANKRYLDALINALPRRCWSRMRASLHRR